MASEINIIMAIKYLTQKVSDDEKLQFENWLCESVSNKAQFDELKKYWEHAGNAYSDYSPDVIKAWKIIKPKTTDKDKKLNKTKLFPYSLLKIAASILIIVSLGFISKLVVGWWQHEDFESFYSGNNIVTVTLSDGSTVWLNAQSELTAPKIFKGHKRNVFLKGEAFFEVAKNPKKPFKIFAHKSVTEVLGTSFNLSAKDKDSVINLSVVTGKVAFYEQGNTANKIILLPGQNGCFNILSRLVYMKHNDNQNLMAWKTGKFNFRNASLQEVCDALSGYYNIKILPGTYGKDSRYLFTGTFNNAPIGEVLSVLELTLGMRFVKSGNVIKIQR
jgi:transmembrane sensor